MKNLIIIENLIKEIFFFENEENSLEISQIIDLCLINESEELLILFSNERILLLSLKNEENYSKKEWNLKLISNNEIEDQEEKKEEEEKKEKEKKEWFYIQYINENNSIVCISFSGLICSIQSNRITETWNNLPEIEGSIDDVSNYSKYIKKKVSVVPLKSIMGIDPILQEIPHRFDTSKIKSRNDYYKLVKWGRLAA